jgi:hypothetical protein
MAIQTQSPQIQSKLTETEILDIAYPVRKWTGRRCAQCNTKLPPRKTTQHINITAEPAVHDFCDKHCREQWVYFQQRMQIHQDAMEAPQEDPKWAHIRLAKVGGTKHYNDGFKFHIEDAHPIKFTGKYSEIARDICPECQKDAHPQGDTDDVHDCKNEFYRWTSDGKMVTVGQCCCYSAAHGKRDGM